jgi:chemotaxis receptor (MCP) glutamine deamidase CheD
VQDPGLTDTTLSTDLLLLDRCFSELRKAEPRAQHWQAKVAGQVQDTPGGRERFDGVIAFLTAFLNDTNVKLVSSDTHVDHVQLLRFRPAMGQVRTQPLAARRLGS